MSDKIEDGGPAFPPPQRNHFDRGGNPIWKAEPPQEGMTMRQYYKAAALQGLLASGYSIDRYQRASNICGQFADHMLAEDASHEHGEIDPEEQP